MEWTSRSWRKREGRAPKSSHEYMHMTPQSYQLINGYWELYYSVLELPRSRVREISAESDGAEADV